MGEVVKALNENRVSYIQLLVSGVNSFVPIHSILIDIF